MGRRIFGFIVIGFASSLFAQEPLRPTGSVVDEQGMPIAGAIVRMIDTSPSKGRGVSRLVDRIGHEHPLPITRTDARGRYALLIHPLHVAARSGGWHELGMIVEKPGFRIWREHLLVPIDRFIGSQVVLPKLQAADLCSIIVEDPRPGMKIEVVMAGRWSGTSCQGFYPFEIRLHDVPSDGRLEIEASFLPLPARIPADHDYTVIRYEARLLYPGRSSRVSALVGGEELRFAAPKEKLSGRTLTSMSGSPLKNLRGLYRFASGTQCWLSLVDAVVPSIEDPELIALVADGHVATTDPKAKQLLPLLGDTAGRNLRLVGDDGGPIGGAKVSICPLEIIPSSGNACDLLFGDARVPRAWSRKDGVVELPATLLAEPCFLLIEALDYESVLVVEPRRFDRTETIDLRHVETGSLRLEIVDQDGSPIAGALPLLTTEFPGLKDDSFYVPGILSEFPLSDEQGIVQWDHLPAGTEYFLTAARVGYRGVMSLLDNPVVDSDTVTEATVTMTSLLAYQVRLVDADGNPVPYAVMKDERWEQFDLGLGRFGMPVFLADDEGWLRVGRTAEQGLELQQAIPGLVQQRGKRIPPGREVDLTIQRIPYVMLRTPADEVLTAYTLHGPCHGRAISVGMKGLAGSGILIRSSTLSVVFGVHDAPPISYVPPADLSLTKEPVVIVDRRAIQRQVSLKLTGPDVDELHDLKARPVALNGVRFLRSIDSNMAERDGDGRWYIVSRDDRRYDCVLLHPRYVHEEIRLPDISSRDSDAPIEVALRLGKPIKIRTSLTADLLNPLPLIVNIMTAKLWSLPGSGRSAVLRYDVVFDDKLAKGPLEIALPCALEPGTKYVILLRSSFGTSKVEFDVEGLEPETIDMKPMSRE